MQTKLRAVGNPLGVTLPKEALVRLRANEGDTLYLTETPEGLLLTLYDETFARGMEAFGETRRRYRDTLRKLAK